LILDQAKDRHATANKADGIRRIRFDVTHIFHYRIIWQKLLVSQEKTVALRPCSILAVNPGRLSQTVTLNPCMQAYFVQIAARRQIFPSFQFYQLISFVHRGDFA
jgi:hypothetical protein